MASMSVRALLAGALLAALAGCGGDETDREVRLLAPAGIVEDADAARFERETGCRVALRVYDEDEDLEAIADRRDTDALAAPTSNGDLPHISEELVRLTLRGGVVITIPRRLASAFDPVAVRPGGRRELTWVLRDEGDNEECAQRWLAHVTSQ